MKPLRRACGWCDGRGHFEEDLGDGVVNVEVCDSCAGTGVEPLHEELEMVG